MNATARILGVSAPLCLMLLAGCKALNSDPTTTNPLRRFSEDYQEEHAGLPIGARQKCKHGKLWPPFPRPAGEEPSGIHNMHAAVYWPWPYMCQDRQSVNEFIQTTTDNGWVEQTSLYHYHFEEETGQLTAAGLSHLQWILQSVPPQYRTVYVETGLNAVGEQRVNTVQLAAASMVGNENVPPILLHTNSPLGTPAQQIDLQYRSWMNTLPEPRIQYEELPTGTSAGGT